MRSAFVQGMKEHFALNSLMLTGETVILLICYLITMLRKKIHL